MYHKDHSGRREEGELEKVGRTFKGKVKPERLEEEKRMKLERRIGFIWEMFGRWN